MRNSKLSSRVGVTLAVVATATTMTSAANSPVEEAVVARTAAETVTDPGAQAGAVLQEELDKYRAEFNLPGMIGLVRAGDSTHFASSGNGNTVGPVPADPNSKYRIGSNTKAFVSTVLLQLEAEGKLSLDDTVDKWLPGLIAANGNDGKKISIRQLLNHTSGLPDVLMQNLAVSGSYVANLNPYKEWDKRQLVKMATEMEPLAEPGTAHHYSNTGYIVADLIIEEVTGRTSSAEVTERIINPLGLTDTTFPESDPKMYGNYMHGYFNIRDVSVSNVQAMGGAGAIVSTLEDLADFTRALMSGSLLPEAQMQQLKETVPGDDLGYGYGLGISQVETPCGPAWFHTGSVLGYSNTWYSSPDGEQQAIAATNHYLMVESPGDAAPPTAAQNAYCALT